MAFTISGTTGINLGTEPLTGSLPDANAPSGSVIQVVNAVSKSVTTTTGDSYVASTLAASITPISASSKILILGDGYIRTSAAGVSLVGTIYRNSTNLTTGTIGLLYLWNNATITEQSMAFQFLDSPATTSSTTYTFYFRRSDSAGTVYFGNANFDSKITLLEIAA